MDCGTAPNYMRALPFGISSVILVIVEEEPVEGEILVEGETEGEKNHIATMEALVPLLVASRVDLISLGLAYPQVVPLAVWVGIMPVVAFAVPVYYPNYLSKIL